MINNYLSSRINKEANFFDEVATPDGKIYPHWEKLVKSYDVLGNEKLNFRAKEVEKQLRDNGVTYNVYGDPNGLNRPWKLDPIPMMFSETDWKVIQEGLVQRAELLNQILLDIYGERKLIRNGLIPFEVVYNHQGFLRKMDKIRIPGKHQLVQYSTDLARGPNGKMWVLHDRTDAPSGAGYAFENRVAMTRVFPEMIRENHVQKIAYYYQTLKNTLNNLSWHNKENPRIIFLSPGPNNETYFEHAYLSSFLGFTLAVGDDLTVSDGYVWLKTMEGLEKVDIIIRRVDDVFCDPLEFRMDSKLGIVGLMESIRQNKVLVINPLGTRILENPAMLAFLPKLCKHLLGEDLILPSVASWWCGQEKEKKYVLDNIKYLIIRKINRNNDFKSVYGGRLSSKELEKLKFDINAQPYMYVGQELVNFSTTPSYIDGKLEARNAVLRTYTVLNSENDSYYVMPGGLSRSSAEKGTFIVSNQSGGISKDTWVLSEESQKIILESKPISAIKPVENILPSRTGENLFWLGRYIERSIYSIRFLRAVLRKYYETEDDIPLDNDITLNTLLKTLTTITGAYLPNSKKKIFDNLENEIISLILDEKRIGSLSHSLKSFLANGYAVRDRLSLDTWRILDSISEEWNAMKEESDLSSINYNLDNLIIKLMAFHGLNIDNMTREPTWNILNTGRFLESSIITCNSLNTILADKYDSETEKILLEYLLRANESLVTYRYMYRSTLETYAVLSLLLIDEINPKSVAFQVEKVDRHIMRLPANEKRFLSPIRKKLLETTTFVRMCNPIELSATSENKNKRTNLTNFLAKVIDMLSEASDMINEHYFSHLQGQYLKLTNELPEI